jgi:hypothetical protein
MTLVKSAAIAASEHDKTITLGDEVFTIAPLMLRQTSEIEPLRNTALRILTSRSKFVDDAKAKANGELSNDQALELGDQLILKPDETKVLLTIIRLGMSRTYPQVTLDYLYENFNLSIETLAAAVMVVLVQAKAIEKKVTAPTEAPVPAEAMIPQPTGSPLLPDSASI